MIMHVWLCRHNYRLTGRKGITGRHMDITLNLQMHAYIGEMWIRGYLHVLGCFILVPQTYVHTYISIFIHIILNYVYNIYIYT